jgi:hypothetical protein
MKTKEINYTYLTANIYSYIYFDSLKKNEMLEMFLKRKKSHLYTLLYLPIISSVCLIPINEKRKKKR